jgi:hypothetical protein
VNRLEELQRIQVKVFGDAPKSLNLDPFIEIFGRWRGEREHPAQWVDLADYAHVPAGPGIVLVGLRANFSFDMADPAPGVLYAARKGLQGSAAERVVSALRSCLELTSRLLAEPQFPKEVALRSNSLQVRFYDRLVTPNTESVRQELQPAMRQSLDLLFGANAYEARPAQDPKELCSFSVLAHKTEPLNVLLERLVGVRSA